MSKSAFSTDKFLTNGFDSYVEPRYIDVANTDIVGRAQVLDRANMLMPTMGVERVMFGVGNKLADEFGPNGESVYEVGDPRVRVVDKAYFQTQDDGYNIQLDVGGAIEITFYGTGLNLLLWHSASYEIKVSIDGGALGSNLFTPMSTVLGNRYYKANCVLNVMPNTTLGHHTVKITTTSTISPYLYGFEILNEQTALTVSPGKAYYGSILELLSAQDTIAYDSGITGSKGARQVLYIQDNALGIATQEVDTTAKYLTNTDHSNEEVDFVVNWREFGVGRTDDFSTLTTSTDDRAFTLDDGTTTLVCNDCAQGSSAQSEYLIHNATSAFWTFTFMGTGLDILILDNNAVGGETYTFYVDGASQGTKTTGVTTAQILRVCSGLNEGSHTVKVERGTAAAWSFGVKDFIVYKPKKPTLPTGAIELADYNVLADFVANTTQGLETISQGTLRKYASREMVYVGSGFSATLNLGFLGGIWIGSTTLSDKFSYSFFGTGFDFRFYADVNRSNDISVTLNGSALTSANFGTASFSTYDVDVTYNSTTATLDALSGSSYPGAGFVCKDLPLDFYTVEFTNNSSGNHMIVSAMDIITPIHVNNVNVGSLSLLDTRKTSPVPAQLGENQIKSKTYDLTIRTGTVTLTTVNHAWGTPEQDQNGNWWIYLDIWIEHSNGTTGNIYVNGIDINSKTALSVDNFSNNWARALTQDSGGSIYWNGGTASTLVAISGRVPLTRKPDFVK